MLVPGMDSGLINNPTFPIVHILYNFFVSRESKKCQYLEFLGLISLDDFLLGLIYNTLKLLHQ